MQPPAEFDVLGLGCAAVDEVLYVASFPQPDTKCRVLRRECRLGGLTANALVSARHLGARCAFAGRLGLDADSRLVERHFRRQEIETRLAPRSREYGVGRSTIIAAGDAGSRTVLSHVSGLRGAHETLPPAETIRRARCLLIDHHGAAGGLRACRVARAFGVPVVADFERDEDPLFSELLAAVDHLVISSSFAGRLTGMASPEEAIQALCSPERAAVVVTCGKDGCWYVDGAGAVLHTAAFSVTVSDTTGCGDIFHGAYAASMGFLAHLTDRVTFASAAAALWASRSTPEGFPSRSMVDQFLEKANGLRQKKGVL